MVPRSSSTPNCRWVWSLGTPPNPTTGGCGPSELLYTQPPVGVVPQSSSTPNHWWVWSLRAPLHPTTGGCGLSELLHTQSPVGVVSQSSSTPNRQWVWSSPSSSTPNHHWVWSLGAPPHPITSECGPSELLHTQPPVGVVLSELLHTQPPLGVVPWSSSTPSCWWMWSRSSSTPNRQWVWSLGAPPHPTTSGCGFFCLKLMFVHCQVSVQL